VWSWCFKVIIISNSSLLLPHFFLPNFAIFNSMFSFIFRLFTSHLLRVWDRLRVRVFAGLRPRNPVHLRAHTHPQAGHGEKEELEEQTAGTCQVSSNAKINNETKKPCSSDEFLTFENDPSNFIADMDGSYYADKLKQCFSMI